MRAWAPAMVSVAALVGVGCTGPAVAKESVATKVIFADKPADTPIVRPDGKPPGTKDYFGYQFLWGGVDDQFSPANDGLLTPACFDQSNKAGFLGPILGFLVGPLVNLATSHLKSQIDDELKK